MSDDETLRPLTPPADWETLEPLLDAALELPREQRAVFVANACGDDVTKLEKIESLLAECEQPDIILDRLAAQVFPSLLDDAPFELPPVIGERFRVEREIGAGGMAVVFLAHDLKHQRDVAVKVMRPTLATVGADRFLAEIRLTASLRHPHIVPLYDSGEVGGRVFFVMPYIEGESLRARLDRTGPLTPDEAVAIGRDVASALQYAHARGVVHRDVKPSNLLIADGQALLADFGIARAMSAGTAGGAGFTEPGVTVGTPAYMSPEQASGVRELDGGSDIYSLGCVLYEMLAGKPPAPATTRQALASHAIDPVTPLSTIQPLVPPMLAQCIARAMALDPADRFASARDLADALVAAVTGASRDVTAREMALGGGRSAGWIRRPTVGRVVVIAIVSMVTALGAVAIAPSVRARRADPGTATLSTGRPADAPAPIVTADTSRYLVFPFERDTGVKGPLGEDDRLREAMRRWTGISIVDRLETTDAVGDRAGALRPADARMMSIRLGAGRYVRGDVSRRNGTTRVRAALYDANTGRVLVDTTVSVSNDPRSDEVAFAELANHLVLPDVSTELRSNASVGTRSRPALQAFSRGQAAIGQWDLERADAELALATGHDAQYAAAQLWLAQVRMWEGKPLPTWLFLANAAATGKARLSARDRRAAEALLAYADGDKWRACALWMRMTDREPRDFGAWYGAALCQMGDHAVVPDPASPSKWRFRASVHQATMSFKRAFELLPAVHQEFREGWYWRLGGLLATRPGIVRLGNAVPPDTGFFAAYASWSFRGDTLTFIPYRLRDFEEGRPWTLPVSNGEAVHRQRELFRDIATTWRTAFPQSSDAMLALAMALDALGDRSAIDSIRVARGLATEPGARLRSGAAEVWLRVKLGVPADLRGLQAARALADSILRSHPGPSRVTSAEAAALAGLAMLTGRVSAAAQLARRAEERSDVPVSGAVKVPANALQVFAAAGGPEDSIRALEKEVTIAIAATMPASERAGAQARWLGRAVTLGFPSYASPLVLEIAKTGDVLAVAQAAWLNGDTATVHRQLRVLREGRRAEMPDAVQLEALYPEAWLLDAMGDVRGAIEWVGPTLDAQVGVSPEKLASAVGVGSLVRAMAFRAELARRVGDAATAARWANAVATLWSDPDPFLRSLSGRMRDLARHRVR